MKTQETEIKVLKKEHKTGTSNTGRSWEMDEYTVQEEMEREDGSISETKLVATTSQLVGDLEIGGIYKVVIFITSRESEKDGKKSIWNSFRITRAEKVGACNVNATTEPTTVDTIGDEIPF